MAYLCLDLSLKSTGWSKFSDNGRLLNKGRIIPSKEIDNFYKIVYIIKSIEDKFKEVSQLIIEDVYYGINFKSIALLLRLSGAVIYSWVNFKYKLPILYGASHARGLTGEVRGNAQKAEIQVYVLKKYSKVSSRLIRKYEGKIDSLKQQFKNKKLTKGQFKYRMNQHSELIDKETGYGEDVSDSLILGEAFYNEKQTQK